jgi:hypothetical protein
MSQPADESYRLAERQRRIVVRRYASAAEADRHDLEFWMQLSDAERVLHVWRLNRFAEAWPDRMRDAVPATRSS